MYFSEIGIKVHVKKYSQLNNQHNRHNSFIQQDKASSKIKNQKFASNFSQKLQDQKRRKVDPQLHIERSVKKCISILNSDFKKKTKAILRQSKSKLDFDQQHFRKSNVYRILEELKKICSDIKQIFSDMNALFNLSKNLWQREIQKIQQGFADQWGNPFDFVSIGYNRLQKRIASLNSPPKMSKRKRSKSIYTMDKSIDLKQKIKRSVCDFNIKTDNLSTQETEIAVNHELSPICAKNQNFSSFQQQIIQRSKQYIQSECISSSQSFSSKKSTRKKIKIKSQIGTINDLLSRMKKLTDNSFQQQSHQKLHTLP